MQPLYTKKEFMSSKTYDKLPFKCKNCNETFYREKYRIVSVINKKGTATIEFCSRKCSNLNKNTEKLLKCEYCEKEIYKRPVDIKNNKHIFCSSSCTGKFYANDTSMRNNKQIKLNCKQCNKEIYKAPARIKKSKNSFCSVSCTTKYNLAHINMRSKNSRSKLEFQIENKLNEKYPDLIFNFNDRTTIGGLELDIYIPSLRLAFELNGIVHYEPIYSDTQLKTVQKNDLRKFKFCHENNISLCIIDVSKHKYFKETNNEKYLNIIIDIINKHIN